MHYHSRLSSILLLLCTALFADAALGQSLSIVKKNGSEYWVEAAAPADTRYVLQASANLHLWADLNDEVRGRLSYRFDHAGVTTRYFRLTPWTPPAPPITVVLLGDSTVADLVINQGGFCGWGQGIYGYFKSNDVQFVNLAWPGLSTKLFLVSEQKAKMLAIRPDYVFVQFGLADDSAPVSDPMGVTFQEYADNLRTIVQTIRGFEGIPILITPPAQRSFDDTGKLKVFPSFQERCTIMKDVAAELQTHLVDLNQMSTVLFNELGESGSAYLGSGWEKDYNHYSEKGAQVIAGLIVNALPDPLGPYLVGIFDPPPKP